MAEQLDTIGLIRRMAATLLGVKPQALEGATLESAGADELDITMLAMEVEAEFGVSVRDTELTDLKTCEDFANLVTRKKGEGPANG